MKSAKNKPVSFATYRRKRGLMLLAEQWRKSLPPPSENFPHLVFLYPEKLATLDRELLFKKLEAAAASNHQLLVISDCHYSRAGFYLVYEEIGGGNASPVDIDKIIDDWSMTLTPY